MCAAGLTEAQKRNATPRLPPARDAGITGKNQRGRPPAPAPPTAVGTTMGLALGTTTWSNKGKRPGVRPASAFERAPTYGPGVIPYSHSIVPPVAPDPVRSPLAHTRAARVETQQVVAAAPAEASEGGSMGIARTHPVDLASPMGISSIAHEVDFND
jgi:hypothetical protein